MISLILINTQEWLRLKFLQVVFFLAFVYIFISYLLASLSFTEQMRINFDLGLAGLEITTFIISAFISTHALYRDIDKKTIQVILARPIPRWHLLVGYLGSLFILNAILVVALGVTMALFFGLETGTRNFAVILFTILLKATVIGAFGLLIGTLARPMFGLVLTISYWFLTYSVPDIIYFAQKSKDDTLIALSRGLDFVIARFHLFNWKSYHYLVQNISLNDMLWAWGHCLGWIFLMLAVGAFLIRKKEIV